MSRLRKYPEELLERGVRLAVSAYYQEWPPLGQSGGGRAVARPDPRAARRQLPRQRVPADVEGAATGEQVSRCRVQRLMRSNGIQGAKRRGKPWRTTKPDLQARRRPDLIQRDFRATRRNELWVADISYLRCWQGLVFLAFVLDAYSRAIVGWQLATHMRTDLVLDAYTSIDYTQTLDDHRVLASAGSVGDAYDNALAESFVDSFKTELIADRVWRSRSQLELAVVEYIGLYNAARLHQSFGHIPPAEYEQRHAPEQAITLAGAAV